MTELLPMREQIARIIDPAAWEQADPHLAASAELSGPGALAALRADLRLDHDLKAEELTEASLAKADSILALRAAPASPEGDGAASSIRARTEAHDDGERLGLVLGGNNAVVGAASNGREDCQRLVKGGMGLSEDSFGVGQDAAHTAQPERLVAFGPEHEADGWFPIESAPRDGTKIDVWLSTGRRLSDVWWGQTSRSWICDKGPTESYLIEGFPTHWRPLPDPPRAMIAAAPGGVGGGDRSGSSIAESAASVASDLTASETPRQSEGGA